MDRINGTNRTLKLRKLFNECLNEVLLGRPGHFIMNINQAMNDTSFFDKDNKLNAYGCAEFWNEIDKQTEKFELRQLSLKPVQHSGGVIRNFNRPRRSWNRRFRGRRGCGFHFSEDKQGIDF